MMTSSGSSEIHINQPIIFIGMPGSGKSTVGKIIAERLGKIFIDGDDHIKQVCGKDSAEAFVGLSYEQALMKENEYLSTINPENSVIGLPGSSGLEICSRYMIRKWKGIVVQLIVDPSELEIRLNGRPDGMSRIKFGTAQNISELLVSRQTEYNKLSPIQIHTSGLHISESVDAILTHIFGDETTGVQTSR